MSAVSPRCARKLLSSLGLMASASVLSMIVAEEAQANCSVTPAQPLNAITTDNSQVDCSGVTTGAGVVANANNVLVSVALGGTQLNNSSIQTTGTGNTVEVRTSASTTDLQILMQGSAANLSINDSLNTNLTAAVSGADAQFRIGSGAIVTAQPGNISIGSPAGSGATFALGGQLYSTGNAGANYLVVGDNGNQTFELQAGSTFSVQANGLAISGGGGDDLFVIEDTAFITGGTNDNIVFDGGGGAGDRANINGSGITRFNTANVETVTVDPGAGGYRQLRGSNADATQVNIVSGDVEALHPDALGTAQSNVDIDAAARLFVRYTAPGNFNHVLGGGGFIQLNGLGNTITVGGADGGFTGTAVIASGTTAHIVNDGAFGSGTIDTFGTVSIGGGITLGNTITGTGNLIKNSPGTSTLTGTSSYQGGTSVQSGTLQITNVAAVSTGPVDVSAGATFQFGGPASFTFANSITGAGSVLKTGTGTTTLTGTNTYSGGTSINAGTMQVFDLAALGTGLTTVDAGATLLLNYSGVPFRQSNQFLVGGGSLIKDGSGELIVDGSNYFSGGTIIGNGAIRVTATDALGTGGIQIGGNAALIMGDANASATVSNDISGNGVILVDQVTGATLEGNNSAFQGIINIASPGSYLYVERGASLGSGSVLVAQGTLLEIDASADTTVSAAISGGGDINLLGSARVGLTNTNALAGTVNVMSGTLAIAGTDNIGTAALIDLSTGALLELSTVANTVLSNDVMGDGRVVKTGTGTVFVTGSNTYVGGTDIQQGAIRVTDTSFLGSGAITVQAGAALDLSIAGQQTLNQAISGAGLLRKSDQGDLTLLGNSLTGGLDVVGGRVIVNTASAIGGGPVSLTADTQLVFNNATTETMSNAISGAGALTKDGAGVLVIQNANTYTGGTVVNAGRLGLNNGAGLGTGSVIVLQGAQLSIGGVTLANSISGAGQVLKTSNNVGSLTGVNSHTGGTDIQGGTLLVNSTAALGNGAVTTAAGTFLDIDYTGASNVALNNVVSGAGTLIKDGTGTVIVTGANSYTGGTAINAGRLGINSGSALGTGGVTVNSGAELAIGDVSLANAVTGTGRVVKTSAGNTVLTGANTFSGGLELQGGNLTAASVGSLGTGGVVLAAGSSLSVGNAASQTLGNALSGAGSLVKIGTGTVAINSANSFTGGTTISTGQLALGNGSAIGTGGATIASGAELAIGSITLANVLTGAGRVVKTGSGSGALSGNNSHAGGTDIQGGDLAVVSVNALGTGGVNTASGTALRVGNATAQTLGLALTGAGSLIKSNTGDLTVTNNALTGGLTITAGRVLATGGSTGTGSGAVAIAAGAELVYTNAANATFANGLSGAGTFRKLGAGRLLFSNAGTIGSLLVDAGSVRINSTLTGNVTVAGSARLDGTGQVTGTLTNNGTVAPGNSIGTLNVQGNYVHNAGSVLEIEFDGNGGIDLLAVSGTATLNGGTLRFISTTGAEGSGGTFLTAAGGVTGTFATVETVGAQLPLAVIYQPNSAIMAPSVLTARPSTFNAQTLAGADTTLTFIEAMGLTDLRHGSGNRVWLGGLGAWGSRSATASTLTYNHDVAGLAGGINLAVGGDVTVGAAIGWASGDITLGSNGGGGEQSTVLGALTVRYANSADSSAPRLGAGVVYGRIDQDTLRNVAFNGFSASVEGATQSDVVAGFAEAAVPLGEQGNWTFAANGRASYVHLSQDGYTESGNSPLRLQLDDLGTSTLEAEGLLSANINLIDGGFAAEDSPERLALRFDLGGRYLAALGDRAIPVRFAASNAGVTLQGDTRDMVQAVGGVGLTYTTRSNLSVGVGYRAEIGQRDNHAVRATISLGF